MFDLLSNCASQSSLLMIGKVTLYNHLRSLSHLVQGLRNEILLQNWGWFNWIHLAKK